MVNINNASLEKRKENFINKLEKLNGHIFELIGNYYNQDQETLFRCKNCNNEFMSSPKNMIKRKRNYCNNCYQRPKTKKYSKETLKRIRKNKEEKFKKEFSKNKNYEYLDGFITRSETCRFKCKNCGNEEYYISPRRILREDNEKGCNKCRSVHNKKTFEDFKEDVYDKYNDKFTLLKRNNMNYKDSDSEVRVHCNTCNNNFKTTSKHLKAFGKCPYCLMTGIEKRCYSILLDYFDKDEIEIQKKFKDLKFKNSQRYDFYIQKENLLIEVDGKQHITDKPFGREKEKENNFKRDQNKNNYAKANNYKLIRILYNQGIETVLRSYFEDNYIPRNIFTINI